MISIDYKALADSKHRELEKAQARIAELKEQLLEMIQLVDWWAPKDGVPRTYDAKAVWAREL